MEPLIKCEHVDLGYENQDAVINVNMEVCPGDYLCIVGENGSGKSTLIKGLLGLLKPSGGKLTVAEELKTTGIGYLPQQTAAQKDFPASGYIHFMEHFSTLALVVLSSVLRSPEGEYHNSSASALMIQSALYSVLAFQIIRSTHFFCS